MKKNNQLHLRVSEAELETIKRCSNLRGLSVSRFVLSCVIPLCCKIKAYEEEKREKKNG